MRTTRVTAMCVTLWAAVACSASAQGVLPDNLHVDPMLKPMLTWLWSRSPTFRRQCLRIGDAANLTVRVALTTSSPGRNSDALTVVGRDRSGRLIRAEISVVEPLSRRRRLELVAHELEHVVEQLDDLDLASLQRRGVSGVYSTGDHHFETARAAAIGRLVIREADEAQGPSS